MAYLYGRGWGIGAPHRRQLRKGGWGLMSGTEGMPPAPWGDSGEGGAAAAGAPVAKPKKSHTGRNVAIIGGVAALLLVVGAAASPLGAGSVDLPANKELNAALNADNVKDLAFTVTGAKASDLTMKLDGNVVQGTEDNG